MSTSDHTTASIPAGVSGWCWGAFFLHGVWAIRNRVWIGLLAFIPLVGVVVAILLGFKGRTWAWRKGHWTDLDAFNRQQRRWSISGASLFAVVIIAVLLLEAA